MMQKKINSRDFKKRGYRLSSIVAVMCVVLSLVNSFQITSYAAETGELSEYENEILAIMAEKRPIYLGDQEFYREATESGMTFEELLRLNAISTYQNRISMGEQGGVSVCDLGNNGNNVSTNVPLIMQTTTYNCGPTAALQVLYGMGCQGLVTGQTDAEKIQQLMLDTGTNSEGTVVYRLKNGLNLYATRSYEYILGTSMTETQFQDKVETSLFYNTAPIIHARTEYLSYYNGHSSGHYIALSEVDIALGKIRLKDCNWNNAYYGQHMELVSDVYKTITGVDGRYLICMQY